MNKQSIAYIAILLVTFQSCGIINTLTKRKKNNYVNYNLLFADPVANNALRNKATDGSTDNMVRVITINKITGDTIIEWLKPLEASNTTKKILPVRDLSMPEASTATEAALQQNHKAIIISYAEDAPISYKVVNDTVYVSTDSASANKLLVSLANRQFAEDVSNNKKPNRISSAFKNLIKNENQNTNKIAEIPLVPKATNVKTEAVPKTLLASTNTIVGDLYFDTDPDAQVITDLDSINEMLKFNIINWQTYKCKAHVKLKTPTDNKTFNINMRLQQDSVTWASVNLLGIELVRSKISKEKIYVMDYTKDKFFEYNTTQLSDILDIPLAFNTLQNFVIGNPPIVPSNIMLAKRNAKGTAVKIVGEGSNSVFTYNADSTLKAVVIVTNKGGKNYSINGQFKDYQQTPLGKISTQRSFTIIENKKVTNVEVSMSKIEFDALDLEFPYKVPLKFKAGN